MTTCSTTPDAIPRRDVVEFRFNADSIWRRRSPCNGPTASRDRGVVMTSFHMNEERIYRGI